MKSIKKIIAENQEIVIVIVAIFFANILFFIQKNWTMNPVYIALVSLLFYIAFRRIKEQLSSLKRPRVWQGVVFLSVLFSLMSVVGAKIVTGPTINDGSWEFGAFGIFDVLILIFYFIIGVMIFFNLYLLSEDENTNRFIHTDMTGRGMIEKKSWFLYSVILAAAWIPVWLCYYPGIMPEDATVSVAMVIGELPWDNHFPVFYSLIAGGFAGIGFLLHNVNLGIALYSVFQLVIMAGGIGFFLSWLGNKGIRKLYIYFCLAYFAAAPMFGNYAVVMWKDPWFSGLLILLSIFLYEHVVLDRTLFLQKRTLLCYVGLILLMCLMRNNGIYIAILINLCLLIVYRKSIKKVAMALLGSVILVYMITGPLYLHVFSAENEFVESIGIPLQQMARVVVTGGEMNEEESEFLDGLLPIEKYKDYYNPFLVDPVKWAKEFDTEYLDAHKEEFFKTWGTMLTKNFGTYVEQYLMGTYGFWHIGGDANYEFVKQHVAENTWGMYQSSPFETHLGYQVKDTLDGKYDYIATGLLIWLLLVDTVLCWMKKRSIYIIPLLGMIGNWLTLMIATPTAFGVRYVYVCVLGLPLLWIYPWLISSQKGVSNSGMISKMDRKRISTDNSMKYTT